MQGDYTNNGIHMEQGRPFLKYNPFVKSLPPTYSTEVYNYENI
jgi:hypothetical protein